MSEARRATSTTTRCHCVALYPLGPWVECVQPTPGPDAPFCVGCEGRHEGDAGVVEVAVRPVSTRPAALDNENSHERKGTS